SEAEEIVVYEGEQWPKQNIDEAEAAVPFFQCDPRARRRIAVHVTDVVAKCRVGVVNECVFEPAGGTVNFHRGMSAVFLEFPSANSGSSASSASNCNTQSHVALSMAEFFCAANPFQGSEKILAPYECAISSVLSVDPESTTMISPRPSRTSGITLSSVIGRLA